MSSPVLPPDNQTHTITVPGPQEMVDGHLGDLAVVVYQDHKGNAKGRIQFPRDNPLLSLTMLQMVNTNMLPILFQHITAMIQRLKEKEKNIIVAPAGTPLPPPPTKGHA